MDDLISREVALKALDEMSYKSPHESATSVVRKKHFEEILEKFIMQQPSAKQWIPCSEEEPPFGIEVLITRKGTVRLAERSIFDKEYPWYIHGHHSYNAKTVDAWMPLPEPYNEDKHED